MGSQRAVYTVSPGGFRAHASLAGVIETQRSFGQTFHRTDVICGQGVV